MATSKAKAKPAKGPETITVSLAHPIHQAEHKQYLGLDVDQDYGPGTDNPEIEVNRNAVRSLISAGYVADVDPNDGDAVAEILDQFAPPGQTTPEQTSGGSA